MQPSGERVDIVVDQRGQTGKSPPVRNNGNEVKAVDVVEERGEALLCPTPVMSRVGMKWPNPVCGDKRVATRRNTRAVSASA